MEIPNWALTALFGPIVIRLYQDCIERRRYRKAIGVDLRGGAKLFAEVLPQVSAGARLLDDYSQSQNPRWLYAAETLFEFLPSGFVIDECYLDTKQILVSLSARQSEAVTLAIETWRRVRLHEERYRQANDRLLGELSRFQSQEHAPFKEPATFRELISRHRGELAKMQQLIVEYRTQTIDALNSLADEFTNTPIELPEFPL